MGKESDISIKRVGAGKASAAGDFNFEGTVNVKKGLKVNGVDCKCAYVHHKLSAEHDSNSINIYR